MRGLRIALAHENEARTMQFENLPASVGQWTGTRGDLTWLRYIDRDKERFHLIVYKDAPLSTEWRFFVGKENELSGMVIVASGVNPDRDACMREAIATASGPASAGHFTQPRLAPLLA